MKGEFMRKTELEATIQDIKKSEPCFASKEEVINELVKLISKKRTSIYFILDNFIYSRTGSNCVNEYTADDIISIACWKFIDENLPDKRRRRWNKSKHQNFEKVFISACFSLISNEIKKFNKAYRNNGQDLETKEIIKEIQYSNQNNEEDYDDFEKNGDFNATNEEYYYEDEKESLRREYYDVDESVSVKRKIYLNYQIDYYSEEEKLTDDDIEKIIEMIENKLKKVNNEMAEVFKLILEGVHQNQEISKNLGISVKKVNYLKRRIKDYTLKILGEYINERENS